MSVTLDCTRARLRVREIIEDLVDHLSIGTLDLDRMRREVAVDVECKLDVYGDERGVELPLREYSAKFSFHLSNIARTLLTCLREGEYELEGRV